MDIPIDFQTSVSVFIKAVLNQLHGRKLNPGDRLVIQVQPKFGNRLLDLFTLGRLIAFVKELKIRHHVTSKFFFNPPKRLKKFQTSRYIKNLEDLGFFNYCDLNDINYQRYISPQPELLTGFDLPDQVYEGKIESGTYRHCLIPLQSCPINRLESKNENDVLDEVAKFVHGFADQINTQMKDLELDITNANLELSRILFVLIKELLSNVITHSGESEFLIAMTLSRESGNDYSQSRSGINLAAGQPKYELLVMDFGQGISRSIDKTLNCDRTETIDQYFSLTKWNPAYKLHNAKEKSLLMNIFRGDLVIRKGRKSEGLYELGQTLSWCSGLLKIFTGRSELQISAVNSEELFTDIQSHGQEYFLPGVITNAILPSHQIKTISVKKVRETLLIDNSNNGDFRKCEIEHVKILPKGFFGGSSAIKIRRRSEIDAGFFSNEYTKKRITEDLKDSSNIVFWDINLRMSENIDVNFIDSFIQELCKKVDNIESDNSKNFYKLIFTNVPRNIIYNLKKRNCVSFLMLKETFCLFLDENDEPHFLGTPRVSNQMFDVEEALMLIFYAGAVTVEQLSSKEIGMSPVAITHLKKLIGNSKNSIFSLQIINEQDTFVSKDIVSALRQLRYKNTQGLKSVFIKEENAVFKLRNGVYVDGIYDFCLYWSDETTLTDCAKLFLTQSGFPLIDTFIAFMNNGDRLASAIQRFTKTPNLIIIDPHNYTLWKDLEIRGDCILIVDALYPGDDTNGYIKDFIQESQLKSSVYRLKQLWTFYDFRDNKKDIRQEQSEEHKEKLLNLKVISIKPDGLQLPKSVQPSSKNNILQNNMYHSLTKPSLEAINEESHISFKPFQYSPIELSTEFWQNATALKFIDSKPTGRETRNVLFYENNEKLIQTPRMRRLVSDFVADYIKNVLDLKVDVILHPMHPVGSFLAQLVAAQLNTKPLILSLSQKQYGGQIELTSNDYLYYHSLIESHKRTSGRNQLVSLIVDDSVLTGSSLFMMLGIASRLGLKNSGVMVLLSRLKPEISNALSLFDLKFAYLYRLHMPILTRDQFPDRKLKELNKNEKFLSTSKSYFSQLWTVHLEKEKSHFQPDTEKIENENPPMLKPGSLENLQGEFMETHALRQIIQNLILHPDPQILDFYIRVAIAYNFLEQLVREPAFWDLLRALFNSDDSKNPASQTTQFIRKILYILAFSKQIHPFITYKLYQDVCFDFIHQCFQNNTWIEHKDLVTDCIMWLGIIGSERLSEIAPVILNPALKYAFEDLTGNEKFSAEDESQDAIFAIIGSFAWSLRVYLQRKGTVNVIDNLSALILTEAVTKNNRSGEKNLILIDILEPLISISHELKEALGIKVWVNEDNFIQELESNMLNNPMMDYLQKAPGYACTLKTILRLCKAETVLVYAKNKSDNKYFLRVFDTSENKRADDELEAKHFTEEYFPKHIRERMEKSLFFSSAELPDAEKLNAFSIKANHLWCMGGTVDSPNTEMSYYIILGYRTRHSDIDLQNTAYFYWLKCKALLQEIFPRIHSKYVESASEWNAQIQSIRPIHPIKTDDPLRSQIVNNRRKIIGNAMANVDIGDLLRRAVRMFSQPVYRLPEIRYEIESICENLRRQLIAVIEEDRNKVLAKESQLFIEFLPFFSPEINALTIEQENTFCALHMALLKFIAYECLCNSLAYFNKEIRLKIEFNKDPSENRVWVKMIITNDIHDLAKNTIQPDNSIGTSACKAASAAVEGRFKSEFDEKNLLWTAITELPAYKVPDNLRRQLHGLL